MKYSIQGKLKTSDDTNIITLFNTYTLWRLVVGKIKDIFTEQNQIAFEVWLNSENDKTQLFNDLKSYVDLYKGKISWHECTHDEENPTPCVIVEEYEKE